MLFDDDELDRSVQEMRLVRPRGDGPHHNHPIRLDPGATGVDGHQRVQCFAYAIAGERNAVVCRSGSPRLQDLQTVARR